MSYTLKLYHNSGRKDPFSDQELRTNLQAQREHLSAETKDDRVNFFMISKDSPKESIEFHFDNEGYYWTSCSYGVDQGTFSVFVRCVKEIATSLDMLIQDPQVVSEPATLNYHEGDYEAKIIGRFMTAKKILEKVPKYLPSTFPAKGKFFILLSVTSQDPVTGKNMLLTSRSGVLYASKVEAGESIEQVVKREIPELTGSGEFSIIDVFRSDSAKDRQGNDLPRHMVVIRVPYFDPKTRNTEKEVEWRELDRFVNK